VTEIPSVSEYKVFVDGHFFVFLFYGFTLSIFFIFSLL